MPDTDGERLAPVTYLFGAPEPVAGEPSPSVRADDDRPEADDDRLEAARAALATAEQVPVAESRPGFGRIANVSMHALARRGMSSREMHDYLVGREFEPDEVEAEVDRLESVGLLDDGELAEVLVRRLLERKGLGRTALVAELKRRKLHPDAIDSALAELETDDELARATELARRRAPQLRSLDTETAKRRLSGFLMRKGYGGSVVSKAVASALEPTGPVFR